MFNLGVLGYTSYQGLELLKSKAIKWEPDVLVIGFAMNDPTVPGYRDKDLARTLKSSWTNRILEHLESYKLPRYWLQLSKYKPKSTGDYLKVLADPAGTREPEAWASAETGDLGDMDYEKFEPWTRVSPLDYEKNLHEMINLARSRKAAVILLYNELRRGSPYHNVLEKISRMEGVPLVDSNALVAEARRKMETEVEEKLDLVPPKTVRPRSGEEVEMIFRVYMGERHVPKAVYITGAHPKLGDRVPNRVAMYDDGTHGDQRAADSVWSYAATFSPGTKLYYIYTNSGEMGRWEGLDVPQIRGFTVAAANNQEKVYRPIESFGKIYMQADGWHTNAAGYELIARAIRDVLLHNEKIRELSYGMR